MQDHMKPEAVGKLAIVTGASSGIGKELARGLALEGAKVIMACRNLAKAAKVKAEILAALPKADLVLMQLDLSSLASARAFASAFLAANPKLDILINNAGGWTPEHVVTPEGFELTWVTNVLAPDLLTRLLLPALKAAGKSRIVNVASTAASGLSLDDIEFKKRKYSGMTAYSQTKQANRMLTWALAAALKGSSVTANAMSPGLVKTDLNRDAKGILKTVFGFLVPMMGRTPEQGADTALWLAVSEDVEGVSNIFFENRGEKVCKFRAGTDAIKRLEEICLKAEAA